MCSSDLTFYDYAGVSSPMAQHARSVRPLIETDGTTRDFAMNEWELLPTRAGVALSLTTVRSKTHKLTVDAISGTGEMYDLVNDPAEMNNVFEDSGYKAVRRELEDMIASRPDDTLPIQKQVGRA